MRVVIVGGGHAAAQLCGALVEGGFAGQIVLVSEEEHLPYHRPPLSKALLKDPQAAPAELRGASFYEQAGIELKLGWRAVSVDRAGRQLKLSKDGGTEEVRYDHLVLATGSRSRRLPGLDHEAKGVNLLRGYGDALALRRALDAAQNLVVLGGGFIGLEIAATARALGKVVTVVEAAPRLLARAVSPELSEHLLEHHRAMGVDVRLGQPPERIHVEQEGFRGLRLGGKEITAELLIVGIGAVPETTLAEQAGLACDNGVVVDACMATDDPHISAMGDCTAFPYGADGRRLRLESVQNAHDQARTLAARLLGKAEPYACVPWFWSEQGDLRLQIAGLWHAGLKPVKRPGAKAGSFSWLHYGDADKLVAVESVNAPMDHMAAKRWLQQGHSPSPSAAADPARPVKEL
jgi:3-phenylpropionate/trans-cinnamate dioxygenase ferredoxin reductase subunit